MSIIFALRSDDSNYYPRYTLGTKVPTSRYGATITPVQISDATAIGSYSYDLSNGGLTNTHKGINYRLLGTTNRARSALVRILLSSGTDYTYHFFSTSPGTISANGISTL